MLQVKLFKGNEEIYIEKNINEWLAENQNITIIDIKTAMAGSGGTSIYSLYTIIYKPLDSK